MKGEESGWVPRYDSESLGEASWRAGGFPALMSGEGVVGRVRKFTSSEASKEIPTGIAGVGRWACSSSIA
jgi:hypothetical protein